MVENSTIKDETDAIVFIEGNNFYHNLAASYIKPSAIHFGRLSEFLCEHFGFRHKKSFYYNSIPSIADGKDIYFSHMKFLDEVKNLPKFEVRTRKLQRHSAEERVRIVHEEVSKLGLCKMCEPVVLAHWKDYLGSTNVKEKGIDVQIAVDMIKNCLIDKECGVCILVSGDADFIPALDLIKLMGKEVFTASLAKGYSYELRSKHSWFILDKKLIIDKCLKK